MSGQSDNYIIFHKKILYRMNAKKHTRIHYYKTYGNILLEYLKLRFKHDNTFNTVGSRASMTPLFKAFLLLFVFSSFIGGNAQTAAKPTFMGSVKGKIIDQATQESVPYASIVIKSKADGSIITGGITNDNGNFEVKDIPGQPIIFEVQYIGYELHSQDLLLTKLNNNINLDTIAIKEEAEALDGITIVAERSTIEQKIDRKIINVGKDLTTAGASAADIMVNVPSVDVDQNGNLSLRGNDNVRVLIDGKPTNISSDQLLKQIPSTSIKKIELITNPSAKYNPEGMSGIINIVLHKSAKIGFNGSANLGLTQGEKTRFNSSLDLNYRTGKVNIYGNYGNNLGKNILNGEIFRSEENSDQIWENLSDNTSHLFKVGLDYYLDDNNTISFYTTQNVFDGEETGSTDIIYNDNDIPNLKQTLLNLNDNNSSTYNFDYKHNFKKDGQTIEFETDYNVFNGDINTDFGFIGGGSAFSSYEDAIDNERNNLTVNLDYVDPLSETTKLELGSEARLRRTDNEYLTTNDNFNDSSFVYDMDIYSLYGTYSQNFSKWSYQIGARLESYDISGSFNQAGEANQKITDNIFSVYPSAFLKYIPNEEDEKNAYQISFSRRVDRPSENQVNPIRAWSTPRITSQGNPNLNPQFTNSIEFNYIRKLGKGSITTGVFYRLIEDEINRIGFDDPADPTKIILSYDNYDNNSAYGFEISASYKFTSWWSVNSSFDFYSQTQKGVVEEEALEVDNLLYNFRMSHSFKATKNLTFQLFGLYRGASENLQFKVDDFYFVNAGGRYNFMDGKGTLSLNFNDIFKTQRWGFNGERPLRQIGEFTWDSRTVYLGLSYRFGQGKNKSIKRKKRDKNEKKSGGFL